MNTGRLQVDCDFNLAYDVRYGYLEYFQEVQNYLHQLSPLDILNVNF